MEESCFGAMDPGGEDAGEVGGRAMDGLGLVVSQYVDFGKGGEFVVGFISVLVAFDVEDVGGHWKGVDYSADGLNDVVVRSEKVEGGSLLGMGPVDIVDD
jgi:hypothetical protein